ncbi:MAG TPA: hypothetical protein VFW65_02950, partial [Pseudonocardiaceae bacterium]|nr:hypothetical protein [Pseudonocardiaceae bacterium]
RPVASSLNYVAGQTVPNLVTVPLGADGNVDFFNHVGTVDVVADLEGYYADRPPGGGEFLTALQDPERLLDTRDANSGTAGKPVGAGGIAQVSVRNVDPDAEETIGAVVVNVTVTASTTTSFLTVYPDGATRPTTSNLNFTTGQTISNLVTVPVLSDGVVDIFNHVGTAHVIVDLEGYYTHPFAFDPATAATSFTPLSPTRILDTRTTTGGHHAVIGPRGRATLQVAGMAGIPADATSVVLNVTGVSPTAATFVTAVPDGAFDPGTSDLNIAAGQTVPNMVVVPIASNGKIDFFNNAGQINVVADVTGYFAD